MSISSKRSLCQRGSSFLERALVEDDEDDYEIDQISNNNSSDDGMDEDGENGMNTQKEDMLDDALPF